jgi:putative DNA primase/helicase
MGIDVPVATDLPEELTKRDQWVCWRQQTRNGKQTKVPVNPQTGSFGSATNSDSWTSFEEAREYASNKSADGIGFVFTEYDPLVGVDLDDCRIPETGTLTSPAKDIVETLASYTEVSPSGTGVHVLVRGSLPGDRNRKGSVELYDTARFFTVTGKHLDGTPFTVESRADEIVDVYTQHLTDDPTLPGQDNHTTADSVDEAANDSSVKESYEETTAGTDVIEIRAEHDSSSLSDDEIISRAQDAANGEKFSRLWRGDTSGYGSHSEADMALCALLAFWTGGDERQLDRLFRDSGLYREKWDERHYADGSTYGEKTIDRVLASTTEFYEPSQTSRSPKTPSKTTSNGDSDTDATIYALQQELEALRSREENHLDVINELRTHVETLETENARLRAVADASVSKPVERDTTPPQTTSTFVRLRRWIRR